LTEKEKTILTGYFNEQLEAFKQKKNNAESTLDVGEFPMQKVPDINTCAALMKTIETIYNMEEAITKS
jgi:hypothetical protein